MERAIPDVKYYIAKAIKDDRLQAVGLVEKEASIYVSGKFLAKVYNATEGNVKLTSNMFSPYYYLDSNEYKETVRFIYRWIHEYCVSKILEEPRLFSIVIDDIDENELRRVYEEEKKKKQQEAKK